MSSSDEMGNFGDDLEREKANRPVQEAILAANGYGVRWADKMSVQRKGIDGLLQFPDASIHTFEAKGMKPRLQNSGAAFELLVEVGSIDLQKPWERPDAANEADPAWRKGWWKKGIEGEVLAYTDVRAQKTWLYRWPELDAWLNANEPALRLQSDRLVQAASDTGWKRPPGSTLYWWKNEKGGIFKYMTGYLVIPMSTVEAAVKPIAALTPG